MKQEAAKTFKPANKLSPNRPFIEETRSPGILSIKSPGMKSAHSVPQTSRYQEQQARATVMTSIMASSVDDDHETEMKRKLGANNIKATIESNKEQIRQLLKESAKVCKQHDAEQKFLKQNILQQRDLKRYRLFKFVAKTFQIDVGNMCLPLKIHLSEIEGEYIVYLSFKQRWPNEANGFDWKF